MNIRSWSVLALSLLLSFQIQAQNRIVDATEHGDIQARVMASGLEHPWGMAFLPSGDILLTERSGQMILFDAEGKSRQTVSGLPDITARGQGGLLDVAVHPRFSENRWVYFSYVAGSRGQIGTEVARGRLEGRALTNFEVLFRLEPKSHSSRHFGSRLVFDKKGYLFITLGDRGERQRAQDISDHAGTLVRLTEEGRVPADNPFVGRQSARPEIYSYGHRNLQGAALHPQTQALWVHEHGPQGGDEINIPQAGRNYGWPVITYGVNYGSGTRIGEGTEKPGMEQPIYTWVPSIAPSGMAFYTGERFPAWENNLFVGSLAFRTLVRLEIDGEKIIHEERLFEQKLGRIRDIEIGPDGYIYLLTDASNGFLLRLEPVAP